MLFSLKKTFYLTEPENRTKKISNIALIPLLWVLIFSKKVAGISKINAALEQKKFLDKKLAKFFFFNKKNMEVNRKCCNKLQHGEKILTCWMGWRGNFSPELACFWFFVANATLFMHMMKPYNLLPNLIW